MPFIKMLLRKYCYKNIGDYKREMTMNVKHSGVFTNPEVLERLNKLENLLKCKGN